MSGFSADDYRYMARAMRLAERGLYSTRPNPAVGAVVVKDGQIVGEGYHVRAGEPHAERIALQQAGEAAKGSTVYVTLEPCSHQGRTPPCAHALIQAQVARVVVAMIDPNPEVSGQGVMLLRSYGIEVEIGLMTEAAMALNRGFIKAMTEGLPCVRLKTATGLDGATATAGGESQWITDEAARQRGHLLRARHGAIMTGIGTVLADDPSLNVRLPEHLQERYHLDEALCHPIRVVLDSQLRFPQTAKMLNLPGQTLIATTDAARAKEKINAAVLHAMGVEFILVDEVSPGRLDLQAILRHLAREWQVRDLLVEAGPTLSGAMLEEDRVDELHWFRAAKLLGGDARPACALPPIDAIEKVRRWTPVDCRQVGSDLYEIYRHPEVR
ncbi:diaminohydroxyphosphoribosylaminopyrimidine deaminase [Sulfurivirga caldicuralii]|uniref:Riboflavin biosynthesis protein RibD n=1 Tax=Sulfurivirga caldicuralii TaxID=364032 RepID=A0A1N6E2D2_9GAMM|nr:bifunctional diaminohydroxyphosphoribosylaminopyrimidine deaminase/5-amino-6-(5-phosphoribosylamino)uracil reductase RibD [Sulfurivirga caldicuralii]SIN77142.1 diaminohydroxyphosphoribosylaminopyrimidine deaminase [Sulfurivirga caldicuralii]